MDLAQPGLSDEEIEYQGVEENDAVARAEHVEDPGKPMARAHLGTVARDVVVTLGIGLPLSEESALFKISDFSEMARYGPSAAATSWSRVMSILDS